MSLQSRFTSHGLSQFQVRASFDWKVGSITLKLKSNTETDRRSKIPIKESGLVQLYFDILKIVITVQNIFRALNKVIAKIMVRLFSSNIINFKANWIDCVLNKTEHFLQSYYVEF